MKIKAWSFGLAGSVTLCSLYACLAATLKLFPSKTLKFIGTITMMPKLSYVKPFLQVTPRAIALGLFTHGIAIFLIFWLIATLYNLFQK
jgi:hypothetical protein